jgi:PAS domain S-box-containing protein
MHLTTNISNAKDIMGSRHSFSFPGNQVTAQLARDLDWSTHPLGPPDTWPLCLKLNLNTVFTTKHPVTLYWGEEKFFFYNDAFIPILGADKHPKVMGKPGREVWPEVWDSFSLELNTVLETGEASLIVDRHSPIKRPDKSLEAFFTYSISPLIDENGMINGTLVISVETTEQVLSERKVKLAQKELLEALNRFKQMSDSLPQLVWTSLPNGHCNYLNKQWTEYTGRAQEEMLGDNWIDLTIHPDDRERTKARWIGAMKGFHPYDIEYRIRRHDGVYRWFKARGSAFKNEAGKTIIWFGTCTDIEDTKQEQFNYEKNVDLSPAMLWITEADGYCSYLSNQWHELTGQAIEEGLGFGWLEYIHPDDKFYAAKTFGDANKNHEHFAFECRLKTKDGSYRWSIDAGNPRFGPHGEYLGMAGTVFDVHEKKLAEEALKESRADLYRVLMQAPSGVAFLKGPDLVYSLANSRYQEIFAKEGSIIGKPMRQALPQIAETSFRIFEKVYRTGEPFSTKEYKSTMKSDKDVYFNFSVQRITNSKGEPEGVIVIGDDVTEQVKDRMARDALTKQLQAIVENMNEGLILCDENGKMLLWNPAACKMHGLHKAEDVFEYYSAYPKMFQLYSIEGDLLELDEWPITRTLRGEKFIAQEYIVESLETSERWIGSYSGSPIFDNEGRIVFAVMTIRDVTSRINSEKILRDAINSRDEFLSIISHELKTPLTSLKLQNQSAIRKIHKGNVGDLSTDRLSVLFDKNENQINRVIRLVDDMLDLTRIQSGKFSYNFIKCDLHEVAMDVYERFKDQFESAGMLLSNQSIESVVGFFDRDRIEQLMVNLLTNALKYGKGNAVTIRLEVLNNVARLEIQDHGIGVKPENVEIIFKKYERIVSADEVSGLGIGLFICREIVEAHGGKIWVESTFGEGSKFIAELPLDANNLK